MADLAEMRVTIRWPWWLPLAVRAIAACVRLGVPLDYERLANWLLRAVSVEEARV